MMYWGEHMSTGGWIFSILGTLIIVALIVGVVAMLASTLRDHGAGAARAQGPSAREILDRRLASGELSVEEYEQLRVTLTAGASGVGASATPSTRPPRPVGALG